MKKQFWLAIFLLIPTIIIGIEFSFSKPFYKYFSMQRAGRYFNEQSDIGRYIREILPLSKIKYQQNFWKVGDLCIAENFMFYCITSDAQPLEDAFSYQPIKTYYLNQKTKDLIQRPNVFLIHVPNKIRFHADQFWLSDFVRIDKTKLKYSEDYFDTLSDRYISLSRTSNIMQKVKDDAYYKYDTHWTSLAASEVLKHIVMKWQLDLDVQSYTVKKGEDFQPDLIRIANTNYNLNLQNTEKKWQAVATTKVSKTKKILVLGDSFREALVDSLQTIAEVKLQHIHPFEVGKVEIDSSEYDYIFVVGVERNID